MAAWAARRGGGLISATAVTVTAAALPLAALPDLAWGVGGRLIPVEYPASWQEVRTELRAETDTGALVVSRTSRSGHSRGTVIAPSSTRCRGMPALKRSFPMP